MNPMAHVAAHAAVKEQIEEDPLVRTAFEKMVATTTSDHHAEHVLAAMLMKAQWESAWAIEVGKDPERAWTIYIRKFRKLSSDSAFRIKLTRQFTADHSAFE